MSSISKLSYILFLYCLSFCHSVILSETLTLLITFEQWVVDLCHFTWVFLVIDLAVGTIIFDPVTLTSEFDPFSKTITMLITFEQWVPVLSYCTWASSYWYQDIYPCDLGHLWNWPLGGAFVFHKHILFVYMLEWKGDSLFAENYNLIHLQLAIWE